MNLADWTPKTWAGVAILAAVAGACLFLVWKDPGLTAAWATITQIVVIAGRMVGAGG